MTLRFQVADIYGRILSELQPGVESVAWRLNNVGQCKFSLSRTDPKCIEDYLRFGNLVLISFDNGLPDWGGMIDPPREWGASIIGTAYSGEYLFGLRQTDKGRYFSGATVGAIYQALVNEADDFTALGVALGSVWAGGDAHSPDYHFGNLLNIFSQSLADRLSDADFDVTAAESGGRVVLTANLYERKGADKLNYSLIEGTNCEIVNFSEQGSLINSWDMAGEGDDWGDDRPISHAEDASSIATYGLRQSSQIYSDVSVQATLDSHASLALAQSKDPHNMFSLQASDVSPARFRDYDVGDRLRLMAHSVGFKSSAAAIKDRFGIDTTVRIWAREYSPASNLCQLVVREE